MGDMDRETPCICVVLEDQQETYQVVVVRVEGNISMQSISVLINPGSTHSYASVRIAKSCGLKGKKHVKSWLVQLATGTKRKVSEVVEVFPIELNGFLITTNLNILALGSYDTLIGMDWMEKHRAKVDCYDKIMECHNEK